MNNKFTYYITLSTKQFSTSFLAQTIELITENNCQVIDIKKLSTDDSPVCYDFFISSEENILPTLTQQCLVLAQNNPYDISVQADLGYRNKRKLVCFDMDSTLIEQEVIVELAKAAGIGNQVAEITESAMRGEIDFNESFTQRVALLRGLSTDVLDDIANNLTITEGAEKLINNLKAQGYHTAILSGGFTYFAEYLKNKLGIDEVHANVLDIEDGIVTGNVVLPIVDGNKKAEILQNISKSLNLDLNQVVAIGDGANDLQMLALSGLGVAFRAKPLVREKAKQSISNLGLDGVLYLLGISKTV